MNQMDSNLYDYAIFDQSQQLPLFTPDDKGCVDSKSTPVSG
jgi:hypothetical protein